MAALEAHEIATLFPSMSQVDLDQLKESIGAQGQLEEILLFEEWEDTTALYRWAGPSLTKPRLVPGAEELVDDLTIAHYEALDVDPLE